MLAKLEFTLPEQADELEEALKGHDWKLVTINALDAIRSKLKYSSLTPTTIKELEGLRATILDDMEARALRMIE